MALAIKKQELRLVSDLLSCVMSMSKSASDTTAMDASHLIIISWSLLLMRHMQYVLHLHQQHGHTHALLTNSISFFDLQCTWDINALITAKVSALPHTGQSFSYDCVKRAKFLYITFSGMMIKNLHCVYVTWKQEKISFRQLDVPIIPSCNTCGTSCNTCIEQSYESSVSFIEFDANIWIENSSRYECQLEMLLAGEIAQGD